VPFSEGIITNSALSHVTPVSPFKFFKFLINPALSNRNFGGQYIYFLTLKGASLLLTFSLLALKK
jgi:hypothetical protein